MLFPTGRLLSARWRPIAAVAGVAIAAIAVGQALQPTLKLQHEDYTVRNPTGLNWVPDAEQSVVGTVLLGLLVFCALAAVFSLVVRFRRSRGVERQQLKWFTYAAALMIVCGLLPLPDGVIEDVLFGLTVAFVPISAGVAILRYRLYDIDRIINRTLVYGLLTVLLGAVYVGLVLALGQLFGGFGTETPSWAVAGATLAVAAMFQPARRRIQQAVDRRFNRSKYNAAKTIEGFSTRLREQVDLDTLSTELLAVVDQTMQPTTTSLWLRPSARPLSSGRGQGG